jgi:DNA-binding CsgD family transcriptional regulator
MSTMVYAPRGVTRTLETAAAWLLGIDRLTVRRYLKSNLNKPPLVVTRDRRWKHVLDSHVARLQALNERDRAMLRAHEAGATYREIAARVGIWPGQVGMQIHKARKRLKMGRLTPVENYFNEVGDLERLSAEPVVVCRCPTCGQVMKTPPPGC